ncbi:MAG: hypothetical protein Q8R35_01780 [bacterium]|nr:hypothetical protein [bacterium]
MIEKHARNILASLQLQSGAPNTLKRVNEVEDFWGYGKSAIGSAEFLLQHDHHFYAVKILLTHGLELLFKALLRIKNENKYWELRNSPDKHNYQKFYESNKGFYPTLSNPELDDLIRILHEKFSENTVKARYDTTSGSLLPISTFCILHEKLIVPHESDIEKFLEEVRLP